MYQASTRECSPLLQSCARAMMWRMCHVTLMVWRMPRHLLTRFDKSSDLWYTSSVWPSCRARPKYVLVWYRDLAYVSLVDQWRLLTSRDCLSEGVLLTTQSALDRLKLSLSRKVEESTLNFCVFYLLGFILSKDLSTVDWRLAVLASVTCDLVPFIKGTLWWYTLVCTMVGFACPKPSSQPRDAARREECS